jgi:hypothetical protein
MELEALVLYQIFTQKPITIIMWKDYEASADPTFIMNLDADNLYGWGMSQLSHTYGFKWLDENVLNNWRNMTSQE